MFTHMQELGSRPQLHIIPSFEQTACVHGSSVDDVCADVDKAAVSVCANSWLRRSWQVRVCRTGTP